MTRAMQINDFEIVYRAVHGRTRREDRKPEGRAARAGMARGSKTASMGDFRIPQQEEWGDAYRAEQKASAEG